MCVNILFCFYCKNTIFFLRVKSFVIIKFYSAINASYSMSLITELLFGVFFEKGEISRKIYTKIILDWILSRLFCIFAECYKIGIENK